jgi:hypothetical protein
MEITDLSANLGPMALEEQHTAPVIKCHMAPLMYLTAASLE